MLRATALLRIGLRPQARVALWQGLAVAVCAAGIELVGRAAATNDAEDLVLVAFAVVVASLALGVGRRRQTALCRVLASVLRRRWHRLRRFAIETGVDLRGTPPLPVRLPPLVKRAAWFGAEAPAAAVLLTGFSPDLRGAIASVSYTLYLALLSGLWLSLAVLALIGVALPVVCASEIARVRPLPRWRGAPRGEVVACLVYFALVAIAGALLPRWVAPVLCVLTLPLLALTLARIGPSLTLLWRARTGGAVAALDGRTYEILCHVAVVGVLVAIEVFALGPPALGGEDPSFLSLPLTRTGGLIATWLGTAALVTSVLGLCASLLRLRRQDPAVPVPRSVHLNGDPGECARAAAILARHDWRVRLGTDPCEPCDVRLNVLAAPMPPVGGKPRWPLPVSVRALELVELRRYLERRDDVQRRRFLLHGFDKLWRATSGDRAPGYWLAPHLWFEAGMTRDREDSSATSIAHSVGPAFAKVFPMPARHHLAQVLRATQIDLLYVESGVPVRSLRRVLAVLFEHCDVHAGRQRIEDRHFLGLPGTRVCVHDFELGNPLRQTGYPEPGYDALGRARVLHVFLDRGEFDEPALDPVDQTGRPEPVLR